MIEKTLSEIEQLSHKELIAYNLQFVSDESYKFKVSMQVYDGGEWCDVIGEPRSYINALIHNPLRIKPAPYFINGVEIDPPMSYNEVCSYIRTDKCVYIADPFKSDGYFRTTLYDITGARLPALRGLAFDTKEKVLAYINAVGWKL